MQDGHTMKRRVRPGQGVGLAGFLESYEPTLVVVRGSLAGEEHPLDRDKLVLQAATVGELIVSVSSSAFAAS